MMLSKFDGGSKEMKRTGGKLALMLMLSAAMATGCRKAEKLETTADVQAVKERRETASDAEEPTKQTADSPAAFSFADVENREFYFSSGAGAWYTVLYIHGDGSFDGHFQDTDMGNNAAEYPKGTLYYSDFSGQFTEPEPVDAFTYRFQIASIEYPCGLGEEIKDGYHYLYSTAYGLDEAEDLYLYLPGSRMEDLPEGYRSWIGHYDLETATGEELPFYGLYNEKADNGFSSYEAETGSASSRVEEELSKAEKKAAALDERLRHAQTQADLNLISGELYQTWDVALNNIWGILKETLDEDAMKALTAEEREWIAKKDKAVEEAGAEYEGGSMAPLVRNQEATSMTQERAYELADLVR